jgi:hypothetical protein
MPELDPKSKEYKRAIALTIVVGLAFGVMAYMIVSPSDSEAAGGVCWMAGCFSAVVTFMILAAAWGKKSTTGQTAQYRYPTQQYPSQRYAPRQPPPPRHTPQPPIKKGYPHPSTVTPAPPARPDTAVVAPRQDVYERPPQIPPSVKAEAVSAPLIPDIRNAINNLPDGLPRSLWGWDWDELADVIASGELATAPDGKPIVYVKDRWYYIDVKDLKTFLQEYKL